jgi:hypothetical protein
LSDTASLATTLALVYEEKVVSAGTKVIRFQQTFGSVPDG